MKKYFTLLLAMFLSGASLVCAQSGKLPPFKIVKSDAKLYRATELPMGKPILLIYFSPDCDHCKVMMDAFFKRVHDFDKASVVMITYFPLAAVNQFVQEHKVYKYPNIVTGTEGNSFFLRNYYKMTGVPFAALYDKNGNLISSYMQNVPLAELASQLHKL
ncbi:redoxin domain-containing protein [Asinibacterium sp. OR53]|uniref:TlpA family protein disulfide reductase n=1 Tax=Asinibacterium sp. OR53 TaxID=925409 RepID=UPI00047B9D9B|nr:redoxin domain-containing protein [Asinibacterium sp. OR53]